MSVYLSPGVYIEEVPSGSKPIEGGSTSVAAFVGRASRGRAGKAVLIHSLEDYASEFGEVASESDAMGLAVRAFYMNGGRTAYICRLTGKSNPPTEAMAAFAGQDTAGAKVLRIAARSVGDWGNAVHVKIVKPDPRALTFNLEIGHHQKGMFVRDEVFTGLSMDSLNSNYALDLVNDSSQYVNLSLESAATTKLVDAVLTGGALVPAATTLKTAIAGKRMSLTLKLDDGSAEQVSIKPTLPGTSLNDDGDTIAAAVTAAVTALGTDDAHQLFECAFVHDSRRFKLTSKKRGSSASVTVYDGALAEHLRLDSKSHATLVGVALDATDPDLFTDTAKLTWPLELSITLDDYPTTTIKLAKLPLGGTDHETDGKAVAKALRNAVRAVNPSAPAFREFDCSYGVTKKTGAFTLTSGGASTRISAVVVATGATASQLGLVANGLHIPVATMGRAYEGTTALVVPDQSLGTLDEGVPLKGGGEVAPSQSDYRSFFDTVLRKVADASVIILPGEQWAEDGSGNGKISAAIAHCEATKTRMLIVDPPASTELEQAAQVTQMALPTSTYTALYYPWIKVPNPLYNAETNKNAAVTLSIPPSAAVAGIWSKTDGKRGVWKAPAGVDTQILGIAGPLYKVEAGEQDQLNPLGINCIRTLPNFGTVVWGARTLATKAKPEWRYVSIRRTAIFIEKSIYEGIQWAVFEPNDNPLWSSLRVNIESFMNGLFRSGAFQGAKASDAYFVRCGLGDTMTQGEIDRGQVIVIVGFAPLKPAEFVIVKIQQKIGQQ